EIGGGATIQPGPNPITRKLFGGRGYSRGKVRKRNRGLQAFEAAQKWADALPGFHAPANVLFLSREILVEPFQTTRRPRTAQCAIEDADIVDPFAASLALTAHQRMLEQGEQGHRCQVLGRRRRDSEQQGPRRKLRKRAPRA